MNTTSLRKLTSAENVLIQYMLNHVNQISLFRGMSSDCLVEDLSDGGMGSFRFQGESDRTFGSELVSGKFVDSDGVDVIVSIYLDQNGHLFELDSWKVDHSPRLKLPNVSEISIL
jgi:hypothetical protein